jgi:hypothetical protein
MNEKCSRAYGDNGRNVIVFNHVHRPKNNFIFIAPSCDLFLTAEENNTQH